MRVEKQVAILYCGTKGLLMGVPRDKVREFEKEYLEVLEIKHKESLEVLSRGEINDQINKTLEKVAKEVAEKYSIR
jgi:F-type H+-transporting ATPase subunit alpha